MFCKVMLQNSSKEITKQSVCESNVPCETIHPVIPHGLDKHALAVGVSSTVTGF